MWFKRRDCGDSPVQKVESSLARNESQILPGYTASDPQQLIFRIFGTLNPPSSRRVPAIAETTIRQNAGVFSLFKPEESATATITNSRQFRPTKKEEDARECYLEVCIVDEYTQFV